MHINKLSIIIPAYNEGPTIHLVLDKIQAQRSVSLLFKAINSYGH